MPSTLRTVRQIGKTCITIPNTAIDAYGLSIAKFTYFTLVVNRKVNVAHMSTANIAKTLTTIAIGAIDNY